MANANQIIDRINALKALMKENQIDALLATGTDPHLSEYTPDNWKTREWITGFTGSYGKVLITHEKALIWTDTRYFLQAGEELNGTGIELMKERVPSAVSLDDWICENLTSGNKIAIDGFTISAADAEQLRSKLVAKGIILCLDSDLVNQLWVNRPKSQDRSIYEHPLIYAGRSRREKIELVRESLNTAFCDSTLISMLDDIAWLFNLRGDEIQYTPLFTAYAYIEMEKVWLFVNPDLLSNELTLQLEKDGICVCRYDSFVTFIQRIISKDIQIDPVRTNSLVVKLISESNNIKTSVSITTQLKAVKDQFEIANIRSAHIKDGVAMVNFLHWIYHRFDKEQITEVSVGNKLFEFRNNQDLFKGESFHPIVGYGSHGAIVHYHATIQSDRLIKNDNLLLVDSGGQYLDGTTDITRTIGLGTITKKQKEDFTICLKSHIALATTIFPEGTKGYSLDAIARNPMWMNGINYGHGTGHGIGYFLSVHEGPMSIRAEFNTEPIREGHLLSNEPGIYRENEYGIRIENVMVCKKHSSGEHVTFLSFETLSLCPIDRNLIDIDLLNIDELDWINKYHDLVLQKITPHIADDSVLAWLIRQCAPLTIR